MPYNKKVTEAFKLNAVKNELVKWLIKIIIDDFQSAVINLEREFLIQNKTPEGLMYKNMTFGSDVSKLSFVCLPELEAKAIEVWELKQKVKRDRLYLDNYFKKVLARMTNFAQLYYYVPPYMHKKLDELFSGWDDIGYRIPIAGVQPDEKIFKLISFYVMSRLII